MPNRKQRLMKSVDFGFIGSLIGRRTIAFQALNLKDLLIGTEEQLSLNSVTALGALMGHVSRNKIVEFLKVVLFSLVFQCSIKLLQFPWIAKKNKKKTFVSKIRRKTK